MKKLLLLFACVALFVGCNKDNPQTEQTIMLHLKNSDGSLISTKKENTAVYLFEDTGKAINYTSSNPTSGGGCLTYSDGTTSEKAKFVSGGSAVYTIENVPNGRYILWVHYFAYSTGVRSSKQLIVNEGSHMKIESKLFKGSSGYEEW